MRAVDPQRAGRLEEGQRHSHLSSQVKQQLFDSTVLNTSTREAREQRAEAGDARDLAFRVQAAAERRAEEIRAESRALLARGELGAAEAGREAEIRVREVQAEAERKCDVLRARHSEQEVLLGKLLATVQSHANCLSNSQKVFEEQEERIRNIIRYFSREHCRVQYSYNTIEVYWGEVRGFRGERGGQAGAEPLLSRPED